MNLLLDTDIFIDYLRGEVHSKDLIKNLLNDEVFFSAITETELLAGRECNNQKKREDILHLLSVFNKIVVDNKIAQMAGDIRRNYNITIPDAIIAASTISTESTLLTRNIKDFEIIIGLKIKKPY